LVADHVQSVHVMYVDNPFGSRVVLRRCFVDLGRGLHPDDDGVKLDDFHMRDALMQTTRMNHAQTKVCLCSFLLPGPICALGTEPEGLSILRQQCRAAVQGSPWSMALAALCFHPLQHGVRGQLYVAWSVGKSPSDVWWGRCMVHDSSELWCSGAVANIMVQFLLFAGVL
jgi:hypothetical protein